MQRGAGHCNLLSMNPANTEPSDYHQELLDELQELLESLTVLEEQYWEAEEWAYTLALVGTEEEITVHERLTDEMAARCHEVQDAIEHLEDQLASYFEENY